MEVDFSSLDDFPFDEPPLSPAVDSDSSLASVSSIGTCAFLREYSSDSIASPEGTISSHSLDADDELYLTISPTSSIDIRRVQVNNCIKLETIKPKFQFRQTQESKTVVMISRESFLMECDSVSIEMEWSTEEEEEPLGLSFLDEEDAPLFGHKPPKPLFR